MDHFLALTEAFLAFALTMMVLATAASALTGVIHRSLRSRAIGLRNSLEYLFRNDIQEILQIHSLQCHVEVERKKFLVDMTIIPAVYLGADGVESEYAREDVLFGKRHWWGLRHGLDHLSKEDFAIRLKGSRASDTLRKSMGEDTFAEFIKYMSLRFASLGAASTEHFARKSRMATVFFGLVLAFSLNIDSLHLLNTFLQGPEERAKIVMTHAERSEVTNESANEYLANTLPIGWVSVFPACGNDNGDPRCARKEPPSYAKWLIGVVLTGLMVGLGAPFWIEMVNTLVIARGHGVRARRERPELDPLKAIVPDKVSDTPGLRERSNLLKIQRLLIQLGLDSPQTGVLDTKTEVAIVTFLTSEGATRDEAEGLKSDLPTIMTLLRDRIG